MFSMGNFTCIRYSVLLLNAFFMISGIVITSLGIYIKGFYYSYELFVQEQYLYAPDLLMVLGVVIFLIAFVGCCGIVTGNSCMSLTFTTFLVLIFFFEMGLGLAGYIMKEEAKDYLQQRLPLTMMKYDTSADIRSAWDALQNTFDCCGVRTPKDWPKMNVSIPDSCYEHIGKNATTKTTTLHEIGCIENFGDFVRKHSNYIEVAGLTLSMLQLLGIIGSCLLTSEYKKGYDAV